MCLIVSASLRSLGGSLASVSKMRRVRQKLDSAAGLFLLHKAGCLPRTDLRYERVLR